MYIVQHVINKYLIMPKGFIDSYHFTSHRHFNHKYLTSMFLITLLSRFRGRMPSNMMENILWRASLKIMIPVVNDGIRNMDQIYRDLVEANRYSYFQLFARILYILNGIAKAKPNNCALWSICGSFAVWLHQLVSAGRRRRRPRHSRA